MSACVSCGATEKLHRDHIIPRFRGGTDTPENIQVLCRPCHLKKTSIDMSGPRPYKRVRKTAGNQIVIQELQNGQKVFTIPRPIAQAMGFKKGDVVDMSIEDGTIKLRKKTKP